MKTTLKKTTLAVLPLAGLLWLTPVASAHDDWNDDWQHRQFHEELGEQHEAGHEALGAEHEAFHSMPHSRREHRRFHRMLNRQHRAQHRELGAEHEYYHDNDPYYGWR